MSSQNFVTRLIYGKSNSCVSGSCPLPLLQVHNKCMLGYWVYPKSTRTSQLPVPSIKQDEQEDFELGQQLVTSHNSTGAQLQTRMQVDRSLESKLKCQECADLTHAITAVTLDRWLYPCSDSDGSMVHSNHTVNSPTQLVTMPTLLITRAAGDLFIFLLFLSSHGCCLRLEGTDFR